MPRSYVFPDANDRTQNSPVALVEPTQLLGLYNQYNPSSKIEKVTDTVKAWFSEEITKRGWKVIKFAGNQCIIKSMTAA